MELRNCRRCGRPFLYAGIPFCPDCQDEDERLFQTLKDYLYDHPQASLGEIVRETGIAYETIVRFLREGRLELTGGEPPLHCERCGAAIPTGRLCGGCTALLEREISRGLASAPRSPAGGAPVSSREGRMYTYRSGPAPKGQAKPGR